MAQATNPSIATGQTGTQYRTQDNDRYAAALTHHSGSTRPSYAVAGTMWLDTSGTPWILKMYDGADDISIGTVNASTNQFGASNAASTGSTIAMTAAINEAGATVASASTTDIGAAAGNYVSVTGITTITALGTVQTGTRRTVRFAGILTLTHNGTSLILPGAANITTAVGDVAVFVSLGSGNWFCVSYLRAASIASTLAVGTAADNLVQLDASAKLPAVDGSQLTNLPASGSYSKVSTATASNSTLIDFTGLQAGYDYIVVIDNIQPATGGATLVMRFGTGAGPTIDSGANYQYVFHGTNHSGTVVASGAMAANSFLLNGTNTFRGLANNYATAVVEIINPGSGVNRTRFNSKLTFQDNADTECTFSGGGCYTSTTAVTAVRFYVNTGNLTTGTFTLYKRAR